MAEEYPLNTSPLAHCVNPTWCAGGLIRYNKLRKLKKSKNYIERRDKPYKAQIGSKPFESLVGLIFLRFFKFICEKNCPRLDIGRTRMDESKMVCADKPYNGPLVKTTLEEIIVNTF